MAYKYYNPNPVGFYDEEGDCVIRAISKALNQSWYKTYDDLCELGRSLGDWGNSNKVWDEYLRSQGFRRKIIPNTCPRCYTVRMFSIDNPSGVFILATGRHIVAVVDGTYYDSWDCGNEVPIYYYIR